MSVNYSALVNCVVAMIAPTMLVGVGWKRYRPWCKARVLKWYGEATISCTHRIKEKLC